MARSAILLPLLYLGLSSATNHQSSNLNKKVSSANLIAKPGEEFGKIVGGVEAEIHEFPFMAALLIRGRQFCGGSLVSGQHVLTAAHCVVWMTGQHLRELRVVLGAHNVDTKNHVTKRVTRKAHHRTYSASDNDFDVAILKLDSPVQFSDSIQAIQLPYSRAHLNECFVSHSNISSFVLEIEEEYEDYPPKNSYNGVEATVAGWGTIYAGGPQSAVLRKVQVLVVSNEACQRAYAPHKTITPTMICASGPGRDTCQGDSGGPIFVCPLNKKTGESRSYCTQIGITSWGRGCAEPAYPGVYTRITEVLAWVQEQIAI